MCPNNFTDTNGGFRSSEADLYSGSPSLGCFLPACPSCSMWWPLDVLTRSCQGAGLSPSEALTWLHCSPVSSQTPEFVQEFQKQMKMTRILETGFSCSSEPLYVSLDPSRLLSPAKLQAGPADIVTLLVWVRSDRPRLEECGVPCGTLG